MTKLGNKHDNGVLEIGTDEVRISYAEDTPGQRVDSFVKEQEKAFHEQKKRLKKNFSQVFQNPLKGFPYNEEFVVKELNSKQRKDIMDDIARWKLLLVNHTETNY